MINSINLNGMKSIFFLIVFTLAQILPAQIPDELEAVWKGEISTFDGYEVLKGDFEIEIDEKNLKNELRFYLNKFSSKNLQNFSRLSFSLNDDKKGINFKYLCPTGKDLNTINGDYNFTLKKHSDQTEYLEGTFKTGEHFGAIIILFRKDDHKALKSAKKLSSTIEDIVMNMVPPDEEVDLESALAKVEQVNGSRPKSNDSKNSPNGNTIRISPDPVKIDADQLFNFNDGFAVIRKGTSTALIDRKGNVVIPYNEYEFLSEIDCKPGRFSYNVPIVGTSWSEKGFKNGIIIAKKESNGKYGALNTNLEVVIPFVHESISRCNSGSLISASDKTYDNKGNVVPKIKTHFKIGTKDYYFEKYFEFKENPDGLYVVEEHLSPHEEMIKGYSGHPVGYADKNGHLKIPAIYIKANPFSEGLAAVSKNDEFGVEKWGFINTKGETVIDFKFSRRPSIFSDGYSLVQPVVKDQFDYAYINKSGDVEIQIKKDNCYLIPVPLKSRPTTGVTLPIHLYESSFFYQGYSLWNKGCRNDSDTKTKGGFVIMDKNQNVTRLFDALSANGWSERYYYITSDIIDHEFIISAGNGGKAEAIANIKGDVIIKTDNEGGSIHGLFDPVSSLTLVTLKSKGKKIFGYVNREGIMTMVISERGIW